MIWNEIHFYSRGLDIQTQAYVLLPEQEQMEKEKHRPIPTLYLLHGLSDDHTMWLRNSRIAQYARKYYLAVVMPAANRSFYTDMVHGAKYWSFVSEELPSVMESCFPLSREREGRFAAGLSMGGYGAMKLGLALPEKYAAIAALSAPLMLEQVFQMPYRDPSQMKEYEDIFGDASQMCARGGNLSKLADAIAPETAPHIYMSCGTNDFLFEANETFAAKYGAKLSIRYVVEPNADHNWDFWDASIRDVLAWLPLTRLEGVW